MNVLSLITLILWRCEYFYLVHWVTLILSFVVKKLLKIKCKFDVINCWGQLTVVNIVSYPTYKLTRISGTENLEVCSLEFKQENIKVRIIFKSHKSCSKSFFLYLLCRERRIRLLEESEEREDIFDAFVIVLILVYPFLPRFFTWLWNTRLLPFYNGYGWK